MKHTRSALTIILAFLATFVLGAALLSACSPAPTAIPTDPNAPFATHTAAALAVQATQTAIAIQAGSLQATQTAIAALPTTAPVIVFTATPSPTPLPTTAPINTPIVVQPTAGPCTNAAKFIGENWKDDTKILAGQVFVKRWTLQNTGTCTWTTAYTLLLQNDSTMGIRPDALKAWRMPNDVKPGENVDVKLEMYAPFAAGTFQASLRLLAPNGTAFGVGANGAVPIYARLLVVDNPLPQLESALAFGDPGWNYSFDKEPWRWATAGASDSLVTYTISDGKLTMLGKKAPLTRWMIGTQSPAYSQFVQATFTTGAACSGKDSYGLVLRAEETSDGIYNRGYVFKFSCDGQFRLYYINDTAVTDLVSWAPATQIKAGPNQVNRMGALIFGGKIAIYANGEKIVEIKNTMPGDSQGIYGLAISTDKTENLSVYVDDFKLWRLDEWLK